VIYFQVHVVKKGGFQVHLVKKDGFQVHVVKKDGFHVHLIKKVCGETLHINFLVCKWHSLLQCVFDA